MNLKLAAALSFLLICIVPVSQLVADEARPNILIVTVDDMSCDSVGAFGCKLADTTPNIDQSANSAGAAFYYDGG